MLLHKCAAWFVAKMWPCGVGWYPDAMRLLLSRFNVVDCAMMFEAITGRKYYTDDMLFVHACSARVDVPKEYVLSTRQKVKSAPLDITYRIADVCRLFKNEDCLRKWVARCTRVGNMEPLQYRARVHGVNGRLLCALARYGSAESLRVATQHCSGGYVVTMHWRTYEAAIACGHSVVHSNGAWAKCVNKGVIVPTLDEAIERCHVALQYGCVRVLSEIPHDVIYECKTVHYDETVLTWFVENKFDITRLCMRGIGGYDMKWLLATDLITRAHLLAHAYVLYHYKEHRWDYDRETFLRIASTRRIYKVAKIEAAVSDKVSDVSETAW